MIYLFRFLSDDGLMLVQGSLGEHHYSVGSAMLPVLDINQVSWKYSILSHFIQNFEDKKLELCNIWFAINVDLANIQVRHLFSGWVYGCCKQVRFGSVEMADNC